MLEENNTVIANPEGNFLPVSNLLQEFIANLFSVLIPKYSDTSNPLEQFIKNCTFKLGHLSNVNRLNKWHCLTLASKIQKCKQVYFSIILYPNFKNGL